MTEARVRATEAPPQTPGGRYASRDSQQRAHQNRSGLVIGLSATLVVALVAMAVIFSIAKGTSNAAAQGTAGILEEASLSAAAAARNRTAQAQVIAEAHALGVTSEEDLALSLTRALAASDELLRRTDRLTGELEDRLVAQQISSNTAALVTAVDRVADLIRTDNLVESEAAFSSEVQDSYQALSTLLAEQRDSALAQIALAGEDAGRLADAARFLVVLLVPLVVLLVYRARTQRKEQRRDLEQQLEKQQAVSRTKDEFIANLSHELRTPLTSIYGFSLEMIDPVADIDPELAKELAVLIATESAELSRMVEDLLTAAIADQGGLVVSIEDVDPVAEVAAVLAPLKATGVEIGAHVEPTFIAADRLRLRQIIRNLVANAHQHGGPNTSVRGRIEGNRYAIEIRDDGQGVRPELEARLFTRFIHESDAPLLTGSVGLGLSIAHLLTARTGGTIAYRRDGRESVFVVTYPLAAATLP